MKKLIFTLFLLSASYLVAFSQSNKEKARELGLSAIRKMENGQIEEAIKLLKEAIPLDPENIDLPYEIAYAHYLDKDYKAAIKQLKKLIKKPNAYDRVHQMLGNCYDMAGKPDKAIATYDNALKLFPSSGILHLERGNMELTKKAYDKALTYYEKGIKVQPEFPSNYYWAAKIYCGSSEEVWGMIYGEIFMNLERNSKRTAEISKMLYQVYQNEITFDSDTSINVSFSQNATITLSDLSDPSKFKLPFGVGAYEPILLTSAITEKEINLTSLNNIRTNFTNTYYLNKMNEKYPNVLFDYQKKLIDKNHFEAYNYWILMKGDEDAFIEWQENNKEKWEGFVEWFLKNPLKINNENNFHSSQY